MNIVIFGLGYVGCISLGCLARNGHRVIGVDINQDKVNLINQGKPTVIENDIETIIEANFNRNRISATMDHHRAIMESVVSIVCVGTPASETGHLNLKHLYDVAGQIGETLKTKTDFHIIIIRSTVPPGTSKRFGEIVEKHSGKQKNKDFAIVSNPEFLREGTSVYDYFHPPYTIIASENERGIEITRNLYRNVKAPVVEMTVLESEILKYVSNSFHALKVCFANEVGNICKKMGIDSHQVMDVFCQDTKLNISSYYLKPGFAYGGSCLPKDLKALTMIAHDFYLKSPVINSIEESNRAQIEMAQEMIKKHHKKKIGFLGLSFKPGTDDLRYSPILEVIEQLLGKGFQVMVYDKNVHLSNLTGVNKAYIQTKLPHIEKVLKGSLSEVVNWAEIVVLVNNEAEFRKINSKSNQVIIDLVRIKKLEKSAHYEGICW